MVHGTGRFVLRFYGFIDSCESTVVLIIEKTIAITVTVTAPLAPPEMPTARM